MPPGSDPRCSCLARWSAVSCVLLCAVVVVCVVCRVWKRLLCPFLLCPFAIPTIFSFNIKRAGVGSLKKTVFLNYLSFSLSEYTFLPNTLFFLRNASLSLYLFSFYFVHCLLSNCFGNELLKVTNKSIAS
jgi:hypothetical protein